MTKYHQQQHHHHRRILLLSLLLPLLLIINCIVTAQASSASASKVKLSNVKCRSGWTGSGSGSSGTEDQQQQQIAIPDSWMNDGYCDCPFGDGNDEPNTNACSGSQSWPGIHATTIDIAATDSNSPETETDTDDKIEVTDGYVCPQQPKLHVPLSRMNDGICDCCDGSDENEIDDGGDVSCPDNCHVILQEERERVAKIKQDYDIGKRLRIADLGTFQRQRTTRMVEIQLLEEEQLPQLEQELVTLTKQIHTMKQEYALSRMNTFNEEHPTSIFATHHDDGTNANELLLGLLASSSSSSSSNNSNTATTLLQQLIIHLCQISGELFQMDDIIDSHSLLDTLPSDDIHMNSCTPFRVAALTLGFSWNPHEDFSTSSTSTSTSDDGTSTSTTKSNFSNDLKGPKNVTGEMIQLIYENAEKSDDATTSDDTDSEEDNDTAYSPAFPSLRWTRAKVKKTVKPRSKTKKKVPEKGRRRLDEIPNNDHHDDDDDDHRRMDHYDDDDSYPRERDGDGDGDGDDDDDVDAYVRDHERELEREEEEEAYEREYLREREEEEERDRDLYDNDDDDDDNNNRNDDDVLGDDGFDDRDDDRDDDRKNIDDDNDNDNDNNDNDSNEVDANDDDTPDTIVVGKEQQFNTELLHTVYSSTLTPRSQFLQQITHLEDMIQRFKKEDENNNSEGEEDIDTVLATAAITATDSIGVANDGEEDIDTVLATTQITATVPIGVGDTDSDSDGVNTSTNSLLQTRIQELTRMRNSLRGKEQSIRKGLRWGASVQLLFDSLSTTTNDAKNATDDDEEENTKNSQLTFTVDDLKRLAIGTIFYGQLSSLQVWQIIVSILPEFTNNSNNAAAATDDNCSSPWSDYCPPKQKVIRRRQQVDDGSVVVASFPPSFLIESATSFCEEEAIRFTTAAVAAAADGTSSCGSNKKNEENNNDNDNEKEDASMMSALSQYTNDDDDSTSFDNFGYSAPVRRNTDTDPLQVLFQPLLDLPIDVAGMKKVEEEKKSKEKEKKEMVKTIREDWEDIGGKDGTRFGRDGEFWTIADDCFEMVAGKYTYEVCLFGKATQKEGNSKSGTDLGQWKGIEYEDDGSGNEQNDNIRVMKWENGAKCWNGPKRSATVYLTCGAEHKIISSDEPDTCRYVFEMESYLACDAAYKVRAGLEQRKKKY